MFVFTLTEKSISLTIISVKQSQTYVMENEVHSVAEANCFLHRFPYSFNSSVLKSYQNFHTDLIISN